MKIFAKYTKPSNENTFNKHKRIVMDCSDEHDWLTVLECFEKLECIEQFNNFIAAKQGGRRSDKISANVILEFCTYYRLYVFRERPSRDRKSIDVISI